MQSPGQKLINTCPTFHRWLKTVYVFTIYFILFYLYDYHILTLFTPFLPSYQHIYIPHPGLTITEHWLITSTSVSLPTTLSMSNQYTGYEDISVPLTISAVKQHTGTQRNEVFSHCPTTNIFIIPNYAGHYIHSTSWVNSEGNFVCLLV